MKRIGDLKIDQDLRFQEWEWAVQRVAWIVMLLIIVLALLGFFGTGPISSATAGDPDSPLLVEYQRFVRQQGQTSLTVQVDSGQISDGQIEVWISTGYVEDVEIEQLSQQPDEVLNDGDRLVFVFLAEDVSEPISVTFTLRPEVIGRITGDIGVVDGPQVHLSQLSYP